ncbi:MAG: VOC family protein [Sphingomonadales bacterium]
MDLNQVTVAASDMAASIAFYETLGLKLIVRSHEAYARFELPKGDATFSLHLARNGEAEGDVPSSAVIYFEVKDVDKTCENLMAKGIKFEQMPTDQSWLWREARLADPFGNPLCIYHAGKNRKNPSWRLEG